MRETLKMALPLILSVAIGCLLFAASQVNTERGNLRKATNPWPILRSSAIVLNLCSIFTRTSTEKDTLETEVPSHRWLFPRRYHRSEAPNPLKCVA